MASPGVAGYWIWWAVVREATFPVAFTAISRLLTAAAWVVILVRGSLTPAPWPGNPYVKSLQDGDNANHT